LKRTELHGHRLSDYQNSSHRELFAVLDFAMTDLNVGADQTTAAAIYAVNNLSQSVSIGETSSTMMTTAQLLMIAIGIVGTVTNVFVFVSLAVFKEFRNNTTNVFVCNQTIVDAVASLAMATTMSIQKTGASNYAVGFTRQILCWFFDNSSVIGATMNASTSCLTIIAIECYFKIVHPVKHRNNFRPWMIKAGVIAPWIDGFLVAIVPQWLTSDVIDGQCRPAFYDYHAGRPYFTFIFIWHSVVPLSIFIFSYCNIFRVVRRQCRISGEKSQQNNVMAGPSSGCAETEVHATKELSMTRAKEGSSTKEDSDHQQSSVFCQKVVTRIFGDFDFLTHFNRYGYYTHAVERI
jgi:hypothetical protein